MARKLELKTIDLSQGTGDPRSLFSYAVQMQQILQFAQNQGGMPGGMNLDEVIRCVDAIKPIKEAADADADSVVLSDEEWRTLRDKLDKYQFTVALPEIVDFGLMIRNAKEIGTKDAKASARTPAAAAGNAKGAEAGVALNS